MEGHLSQNVKDNIYPVRRTCWAPTAKREQCAASLSKTMSVPFLPLSGAEYLNVVVC